MRNFTQLLAAIMLLTAQVAQAASEPTATAAAEASAPVAISSSVKLDTTTPQAITAEAKPAPDFDKEVLTPLRSAQEAKAKAEAEAKAIAAEAARIAAQRASAQSKPISFNASGPLSLQQITYLGNCESGMTANRNSGNGYYGAFQFSIGTWNAMGTGYARADLAPLEVQISAVQKLLSRSSIYTQFPGCARKMSAAGLI
jgi:resuscitation-promoting factor RpfB